MTIGEAKREADLDKWVIRVFRRIRAEEVRKEEQRKKRQIEKHNFVFDNYQDRQQIENDYGYGGITTREFNEYTRIWDDVKNDNRKYEDRLRFIDRQIRNSESTLKEMERIINGEITGF